MKAVCVTVRDPFRPMHGRTVELVRRRCRIRALAPRTSQPFVAILNGQAVLRAGWGRRLRDGDTLGFVVLPQGDRGSNPLAVVAMLALVVAAPYAAGAMLGTTAGAYAATALGGVPMFLSVGGMAVMMGGSMLINALLPPPKLNAAGSASALAAASPTYSLQAQGNSARLDAPVSVLYGLHQVYPDFASQPYAEYSGNDQYLYQLFCVTQGLAVLNEIRIADAVLDAAPVNDGAIHTASGAYADVSYQIIQPGGAVTLFPSRVTTSADVSGQEALTGVALGPFPASPSGTVCNSIAVDLVFPRGLYYANDDGSLASKTVTWIVEAAPISDTGVITGAWMTLSADAIYSDWSAWSNITYTPTPPADTLTQQWQNIVYGTADSGDVYVTQTRTRTVTTGVNSFTAATSTPQRQTYRYTVAPGRYTVRLTRTDTKDTNTRAAHEVDWVGLRAYIPGSQVYGDMTLLALRMRATNQLSSVSSRKINVIAQRHLPVWNGSAWVTQATRSIAWAFADVARNASYGAKLPDARLDLAGLLTLDAEWAARGDHYDGVFDSLGTCWEALTQVARAGRAMPVYQAGILYAVRDKVQTLPVALFTPRNIVRNSLKLDYSLVTDDTCDGVEVTYFDADVWSWQTVPCQLPGGTYLQPAKVKLLGVTDRNQAWREGMYMAAANRYRRRFGSHQTEMEGLIPRVGDLIAISHDMPAWGQSGEVVGWTTLEPGTTLTLSEPVIGSGAMVLALNAMDGSTYSRSVTAVNGSPVVTLTDPNPGVWFPDPYLRERPRYAIGQSGSSVYVTARVLSIRPASPERIDVSWVVESSSVHTADSTGSAPFAPDWQLPGVPSMPVVTGLRVQASTLDYGKVLVSWDPSPGATSYLLDQSPNGVTWTRVAEVTSTSWAGVSLYGSGSKFRVAAVGAVVGPWSEPVTVPSLTPVPALTGIILTLTEKGFLFQCDRPDIFDFAGIEIHLGTDPSFTPGALTRVYDGPGIQALILNMPDGTPIAPGATVYVKAAGYSGYGKTGMIFSGALGVTIAATGASVLYLSASSLLFAQKQDGSVSPSSITLAAVLSGALSGLVTFTVTAGTATLTGTGNVRTLNYADMATDTVTIEVSKDGYTDSATIAKLKDGSNALTGFLTNESITLPATPSGTVTSYYGAFTAMKVYIGTVDDSANWTVSKTDSNCTTTVAGNIVTITAMSDSADTAYSDIVASRAGYPNVTKRLFVAKAKQGLSGASAQVLTLTASGQAFTFDGTGAASPSSQDLTFTANLQNLTGTVTWSAQLYSIGGVSMGSATLTGSGATRTLSVGNFATAGSCIVTASLGGYSDTVTVVRLANGSNGVTPIVGYLTNESVTLAADSSGNVSSFAAAAGSFKMFSGVTDVSASAAYALVGSTGCTTSINATTGAYSVTAMSADSASATYSATYGGVTITKLLTLAKSKAGSPGSPGSPGSNGARGSMTVYYNGAYSNGATTSSIFSAAAGVSDKVLGDTVVFYSASSGEDRRYRQAYGSDTWVQAALYVHGNAVIDGSLSVSKLYAGLLQGFYFRTGSGHTPNNCAFEVTSGGVVYTDAMFGGIGQFTNGYYGAPALKGQSGGMGAGYVGIYGYVAGDNSNAGAHAVRGQNAYYGTSGLVGPANGYDFYAEGSGTNYGPFTGTHDALVDAGATLEIGDLVVDCGVIERNGISSTITRVVMSSGAEQKGVLGVVSGAPRSLCGLRPAAFIAGFDDENGSPIMKPSYAAACELYEHIAVNALGEGQINVCGAGGDIAVGDLIVASSAAGKGMKQADDLIRSCTVAKSREAVTFSSSSEVKQIACIYLCG